MYAREVFRVSPSFPRANVMEPLHNLVTKWAQMLELGTNLVRCSENHSRLGFQGDALAARPRRPAVPARGARRGRPARRRGRAAERLDRPAAARLLLPRGRLGHVPRAGRRRRLRRQPAARRARGRARLRRAASSAPDAPGASRARPPRCCWWPRSPAAWCWRATSSSPAPPSTGCCSARCSGSSPPTWRCRPRPWRWSRPASLALGRDLVGDRVRPRRRARARPARRARRLPAARARGGGRGGRDPGRRRAAGGRHLRAARRRRAADRADDPGAARLVGRRWRWPRAWSALYAAYWLDLPPGPPVAVLGALTYAVLARPVRAALRPGAAARVSRPGRARRGPVRRLRRPAPVLRGVSFAAAPGQTVCVLGPNGGGKTTLFRALIGELAA